MHTTRIFKNGNSQAVRIPADLAYKDQDMTFEIERVGDELRIRPVRTKTLAGLLDIFESFPADYMQNGREDQRQSERDSI